MLTSEDLIVQLLCLFIAGTLNLNDDSILGYDLYSSALAEILSEPSLRTPITVVRRGALLVCFDRCLRRSSRVCTRSGAVESLHY
jgi:hypothetical protein